MISCRSCGIGASSRRTLQVSSLCCANVAGGSIHSYGVLFVYCFLRILIFRRSAMPCGIILSVLFFLHSLRYAYLEQGQDVLENFLDAQAQIYSRRTQVLVVTVDAAGVVELVE